MLPVISQGQTNNYFGTSGTLTGTVWNTAPAGPYNLTLNATGGAILNFNNASTPNGASLPTVLGLNFGANSTWAAGGTLSSPSGANVPITVSTGVTADLSTQNLSGSGTVGYTKNGAGILALAGSTFGGGFTMNAGTLVIRGVNAMGTGPLTINGGIIAAFGNSLRDLSGKYTGGITIAGNFQLGAPTAGLIDATASLKFTNNVSLGSGATRTITLGGTGTYTFGGIISGTASNLILNSSSGGGTLALSGANTYTGSTTVTNGNLQITAANSLPVGTALIMGTSSTATLTLSGVSQAVGSLAGGSATGGGINLSSNTLTVGDANFTTYNGFLFGSGGGLTKIGSGTLTLTNVSSSYSGITTINAGILSISTISNAGAPSNIGNAGSTNPKWLVIGDGTLQYTGPTASTTRGFTIKTGSTAASIDVTTNTLTIGGGTVATGNVGFTKLGAGILVLTGGDSHAGFTTVSNGSLVLNGTNVSGITVASGATLGGSGSSSGPIVVNGTISPGATAASIGNFLINSPGTLALNTSSTYKFEINNVTGTAGVQWDKITCAGAITLGSSPINIDLTSLPATGFNNLTNYNWIIASGSSISGFVASNFVISTGNFAPAFSGTFSVSSTATTINLVYTSPTSPIITPTPAVLSGFTYVFGGGPSTASSFSFTANNLAAGPGVLTVAAPTDFEVSKTSAVAGFGTSVTVNFPLSGVVTATTIWVRLKAGLPIAFYNSELVNISGGSATIDVTVNGSVTAPGTPSLSLPTKASITNITALLGATITSNGGSPPLLARGIVYKTTPGVTIADNPTPEGGTAVSLFTEAISSFNPETRYYYAGYATNSASNTGLSPEDNFYTLSNPPSLQADNIVANASSFSQVDLSWDAAIFPASGATVKGYVLIRATNPAVPTFTSSNGQAPAAGIGTIISSTIIDPASTYSNIGLLASTTYNYLLVPYSWDGINTQTYNYLTAGALTATATTLPGACTPPSSQASVVTVANPTVSSLDINWAVGAGSDRSLVIVRVGGPVNVTPSSGLTYTADPNYGNGDHLGSLNYVVYNGPGTSFTLTNLLAGTTYYVSVFSYSSSGNCFYSGAGSPKFGATSPAAAIVETFEPSVKAGYISGNITGSTGIWNFNNALVGNSASDRFNGTRSARIQSTGAITMLFDKANGLGTITLYHSKYLGDGNASWRIEVSDNSGATFTAWQSPAQFTSVTGLTFSTFTANVSGNNIRLRIVKLGGGKLNIDDITLGNYTSPNNITTGTIPGSPYCITNAVGSSVNVPFTSTGTYNASNVYTAQLSDETGSFAIPTDIGTLASTANSGTITAAIAAGTISGTLYRIRVVSSSPVIVGIPNTANLAIYLNAPDVSGFNANIISGVQVNLGWTVPISCYDEILVVGKALTAVIAAPSGNGTTPFYSPSAVFGGGVSGNNLPANEYAVYKASAPAGSSVAITGLTPNTLYYFKIFTRKGTDWSPGVSLTVTPIDLVAGDFRSKTSGDYSAPATWETWNGSAWVAATTHPGQGGVSASVGTANVTIQSPHIVRVDASRAAQSIKNLTVNFGAKLWANDSVYNSNKYITVYGDIFCNGTIGSGTPNIYDNISFNIEGTNQTISGIGSFNVSRIRKKFATSSVTNLTIAMNTGLKFNSGTAGSSGTELFNTSAGSALFNVTINANTTVDLFSSVGTSGNVSIDGNNGEDIFECGGTFTVNGTMNIPGTLFAYTNNTVLPVKYVIGNTGIVNCVNVSTGNTASNTVSVQTGSAGAGCTLQILAGGKLNMTGGSTSNLSTYNKPFSLRSNNTSPYTFTPGLGTNNSVYDLKPGSIVQYSSGSGNMPIQSSGLIYSNLLITGGAISSINSTLTANRDITIQSPAQFDGSNQDIIVGGDWNNYGSFGFTEGTVGEVIFNGTATQHIYCPGGEDFHNLSISNSSSGGVELNDNVTVSDSLNLGSNGRLFFGSTPSFLNLTNMAAGSNSLLGTSPALIDMTLAAHTLKIGCESPSYTGLLTAGTTSLVNYNRDIAISGSGGNQNMLTSGIIYANLSLSGSNTKNVSTDLTVSGTLTVDGATTSLEVMTNPTNLYLGGNLTLSGGGTMGGSAGTTCLNNLYLQTTGAATQVFSGDFNPINVFNAISTKGAGGISLASPSGYSNVNIKNDLTTSFSGTALFADNTDTVNVGHNTIMNGILANYNFTGTIAFNGSTPQTLASVSGLPFYNLYMNNTAGTGIGLTPANPITVNGMLTMNSGLIHSNFLTVGVLGTKSGGSNISFVNGLMAKLVAGSNGTEFEYPVGKTLPSASYRPCSTIPQSNAVGTFTAEYFPGVTPNNTAQLGPTMLGLLNIEHWDIHQLAGTTPARIKLNYIGPNTNNWVDPTGSIINPCYNCNVAVAHFDASNNWNFTEAPVNFSSTDPEYRFYNDVGAIYSGTLTSFSPFTIAFSYNSVLSLPVRLLSFNAALEKKDGRIKWKVADIKDLAGFELQYGRDGYNFSKLAYIQGTKATSYSYLHKNLPAGVHHYRLLVKDKNDKSFYSAVEKITATGLITQIVGIQETIVTNNLVAIITSNGSQGIQCSIMDVLGRSIYAQKGQLQTGSNQWAIPVQNMASGMYLINITTEDGIKKTIKFIKE